MVPYGRHDEEQLREPWCTAEIGKVHLPKSSRQVTPPQRAECPRPERWPGAACNTASAMVQSCLDGLVKWWLDHAWLWSYIYRYYICFALVHSPIDLRGTLLVSNTSQHLVNSCGSIPPIQTSPYCKKVAGREWHEESDGCFQFKVSESAKLLCALQPKILSQCVRPTKQRWLVAPLKLPVPDINIQPDSSWLAARSCPSWILARVNRRFHLTRGRPPFRLSLPDANEQLD